MTRYSLLPKAVIFRRWGLGRSPNAGRQPIVSLHRAATVCDWLQASLLGEGGSPTLSPFPGERGLGLGIINQFISKTDFFYNLTAFHQRLYFLCTIVHTKNAAKSTTVWTTKTDYTIIVYKGHAPDIKSPLNRLVSIRLHSQPRHPTDTQ